MTTQMEEPAAFLSLSSCFHLLLRPQIVAHSGAREPTSSGSAWEPTEGVWRAPETRNSTIVIHGLHGVHPVSFSLFQFLRVLSSSLPLRPERQFEIDFCSPIRPDILMTFSSSEKPISLSEILLINDSNGATRTSSRTIFCRLRALEFAFFSPKTDEATKR